MQRLKNVSFILPNLKELIGIKRPEIKSEISFQEPIKPEIKEIIPNDTLFFTGSEDKIHLHTEIISLDKEKPENQIKLVSGHIIKLVVKPSYSVKSIKAQFVLRERKEENGSPPSSTETRSPNNFFDLLVSSVFAQTLEPETRFVLIEFELTDPDGDGIYTAEIQTPLVSGEYEIITTLDYEDPEIQDKELRIITLIDPEGYIYTITPQGETRIKDAKVSLFYLNPETNNYELW